MIILLLQWLVFSIMRLYELFLIARAILSWFPIDYSNPILQFLYVATEPVLIPIRNFLMRFRFFRSMPIDFAPLLVFILLDVIRSILLSL